MLDAAAFSFLSNGIMRFRCFTLDHSQLVPEPDPSRGSFTLLNLSGALESRLPRCLLKRYLGPFGPGSPLKI